MLAAQYVAGRGIEVAEVDAPPPGPGEVQLEVAYVGICGTDLHILVGHMDDRVPDHGVIGHEMSGRVAVVGEGVSGWSAGDPVTVMPLRWCGRCSTCLAGYSHICDRLDFVGIDSTGAMQQLWNVPHELLVPLPPDLPLRAAALVEPVAVAHHDVARAGLSAGERVLVVGGGPIGVLIAVIARARGAKALLVEPDRWGQWLDPDFSDPEQLTSLLMPAAPGRLDAYPVSTTVNNVRNNGPELLEPLPLDDLERWAPV